MPETCPSCTECLPSEGCAIKCAECEYTYHLGDCSGVSESTYKCKGEKGRKAWRCPDCRKTKSEGSDKLGMQPEIASCLADICQRLEGLAGLPMQVDEVKQSIELMSKKYDDILEERQVQHDKDICSLKKRVSALETSFDANEIQSLKMTVHDLEWRSRKLNLEVHGIPVTNEENLMEKINDVGKSVNLPELTLKDVDTVHRLPSKPGKVPGIIVRFSRYSTRHMWFQKRTAIRDTESEVTVTENMTLQNRELLRYAKGWANDNGCRFAWHWNGKVFVRRKELDPAIAIHCVADLDRLIV